MPPFIDPSDLTGKSHALEGVGLGLGGRLWASGWGLGTGAGLGDKKKRDEKRKFAHGRVGRDGCSGDSKVPVPSA